MGIYNIDENELNCFIVLLCKEKEDTEWYKMHETCTATLEIECCELQFSSLYIDWPIRIILSKSIDNN